MESDSLGDSQITCKMIQGGKWRVVRHPRSTHPVDLSVRAVCPERGAGAALVLPACNSEAMQLHLDEIATKVTPGAHAIVLLDRLAWRQDS
jgi:hypothetical protein